jgi:uncharacterized protein YutE (UPF0331/DUF86 family)
MSESTIVKAWSNPMASPGSLSSQESEILRLLQSNYESEGYTFIPHPMTDLVPQFLKNYRPDALALSEKDSIVIEVRARHSAQGDKQLSQIAEIVEKQPGWKFRVVYAGSIISDDAFGKPSKESLQNEFAEIDQLIEKDYLRAAMVLAWAGLEAATRTLPLPEPSATRVVSPRQLVDWLTFAGFIDQENSRRLRQLVNVRNAVVHGQLDTKVNREDVLFVRKLLDDLTARQNQPM